MKKEYFETYFHDKEGRYVEIGPLDKPFLQKNEFPKLKYADIRSKKSLSEEYLNKNANYKELADIDCVIHGAYKDTFGENCIDGFFSCHMMEHCSDILKHFVEVFECLKEGGIYAFVLPDKNHYAPDRYRTPTSFRDAYDVYRNGATKRFALDNELHFNYFPVIPALQAALNDYNTLDSESGIFHTWIFDYATFLEMLRDALIGKIFPFVLVSSHAPEEQESGVDFSVVLGKESSIFNNDERLAHEVYRIQSILDNYLGRKLPIPSNMQDKEIYIYGAGKMGQAVYEYTCHQNTPVAGFVVSDEQTGNPAIIKGIKVYRFSELLPRKEEVFFLIAVVNNHDIVDSMNQNGCNFGCLY